MKNADAVVKEEPVRLFTAAYIAVRLGYDIEIVEKAIRFLNPSPMAYADSMLIYGHDAIKEIRHRGKLIMIAEHDAADDQAVTP